MTLNEPLAVAKNNVRQGKRFRSSNVHSPFNITSSMPDKIEAAIRAGMKEEAIRLIAEEGIWLAHREQKNTPEGTLAVRYFDSAECFPVFSSLDKIMPYLQKIGAVDGSKAVSIPAIQIAGSALAANRGMVGTLVLNPASDTEWRFDDADFSAISSASEKND